MMFRRSSAPLMRQVTSMGRGRALRSHQFKRVSSTPERFSQNQKRLADTALRCFSSSTADAGPPTSPNGPGVNATTANKDKKDDSNIFLDNLGKIFLGAIGLTIASLVRSSYGTTNRHKVRDQLEQSSALDPLEVDDLRVANSELTPHVFRTIMKELHETFPDNRASYMEFVACVRKTMRRLRGDAFTIELGHLMDRAIVAALQKCGKTEHDQMPLTFFLTALSLALHSSVPDRVQALFEAMEHETGSVTIQDVISMVGYLQDTCQLIPASQIIETEAKYPTQKYKRGSPKDLVQWEGSDRDVLDVDAFSSILHSKSVCAWGECHNKRKTI